MAKKRVLWVPTNLQKTKPTLTEAQKNAVSIFFEPLIASYKVQLNEVDKRDGTYTIDVYSKWYQHYFYLCEKYKSEGENKILDEYERKYLRLEFVDENHFKFAYFRHTGQWHLVDENCTLQKCLEMINENPNFQPLL